MRLRPQINNTTFRSFFCLWRIMAGVLRLLNTELGLHRLSWCCAKTILPKCFYGGIFHNN